jgi:hypothetical protein
VKLYSVFRGSVVVTALALIMSTLSVSPAHAADTTNPGYTLEGCRQTVPLITFPDNGPYICPEDAYTTGNLGKGWNELDLVPHRVTLASFDAGSVTLLLGGDHEYTQGSGIFGWDVVSVPVLNTSLSGSNCPSVSSSGTTLVQNSNGGAFDSIQRSVTFTGASDATGDCVYDYYQRLALRSSLYSGSSLQSYVNSGYSGEKRISIPVKDVLPQELRKTMTAQQGSDYAWNITKTSSPANLPLGNTCLNTSGATRGVTVRVEWTRLAASPSGDITVISNFYAKNPAARTVTVTVVDQLRSGTTVLDTETFGPEDIAAGQEELVGTWTTTVPAGTTNLNDIATASYTDKVTGVVIPQTITASASAVVQNNGPTTNSTATVTDVETLTGSGLEFSVDSTTGQSGTFANGYVLGTKKASGQSVSWTSGTLSGSGSVTFNKTVYAGYGTSTNGTLSDVATLTGSDGFTSSANASTAITSSTLGTFSLTKRLSQNILSGSETASFTFQVSPGATFNPNNIVGSTTFTFGAGETVKTNTLSGFGLGTYSVHEVPVAKWTPLSDFTFTLSGTGASACAASDDKTNTFGPATAAARKVTVPAGGEAGWQFTLTRNGVAYDSGTTNSSGNLVWLSNGLTTIQLDEGSYVFSETVKPGWDQDASATTGCSFTVNYPANADAAFLCTFRNVQRGRIIVDKVTQPSGDPTLFTFDPSWSSTNFQLADATAPHDSGLLQPGSYDVAETVPAGWQLLTSTCTDLAGNNYSASNITLLAGQTVTCTFTNRKYGHVQVVKTVNGGAIQSGQSFVFQVRSGATSSNVGSVLETKTVDSTTPNGTATFSANLVPGQTYQFCEAEMPVGWHSSLSDLTGAFVPGGLDNSAVCVNFTVTAGELKTFTVDNTPPPGGDARTIGYWKTHASCSTTGARKRPKLDQTLAAAQPTGIRIGDLFLHGSTSTPNVAPDCLKAVRILNKSRIDNGAKMASDPAFNLAAQLLAAKLNIVAGAGSCTAANNAIASAQTLLDAIDFNGITHTVMTSTQKTQANALATTLDKYNNNKLC